MLVIFISGPYSGDVPANIAKARKAAVEIWEAGHAALCPHLNTARFEVDCNVAYEDYLRGDLLMLTRCDAMVLLPGWEQSRGACGEKELAEKLGMPIYHYPTLPARDEQVSGGFEARRAMWLNMVQSAEGNLRRLHAELEKMV